MLLAFFKTLMALLLCLSFVGQTMASSVMSYKMLSMNIMMQMDNESTSTVKPTSNIMKNMGSHCAYMMANSTANDTEPSTISSTMLDKTKNCCNDNCKCFSGMCVSAFSFNQNLINDIIFNDHTKFISVNDLFKSQRLTSLYKPPIIS